MTTRRHVGYFAAAVSLASLLMAGYWPEAKTYHEFLAFPWFCGGLALLSMLGSIIAGRLLSPRWYYLTMFWVAGALLLAFAIWY